jgi:hypothetical protein
MTNELEHRLTRLAAQTRRSHSAGEIGQQVLPTTKLAVTPDEINSFGLGARSLCPLAPASSNQLWLPQPPIEPILNRCATLFERNTGLSWRD